MLRVCLKFFNSLPLWCLHNHTWREAMKKICTVICTAFILFSLINPVLAYDADDMANDAKLLGRTHISLIDAIKIAEAHKKGKGFNASLSDYDGTPVYSVTVIRDDKTYDVEIDANTGEIADDTMEDQVPENEAASPEPILESNVPAQQNN
jgi:hypothetical protein